MLVLWYILCDLSLMVGNYGTTAAGAELYSFKNYLSVSQLKLEIWKSLHQHKSSSSLSKVEQERRVQDIYATIVTTYRGYDLFIQDVLIRRQATLKFGDSCFPPKQALLNNVNLTTTSVKRIQKYLTDEIVSWQRAILQTEIPICDYRLNLECSSVSETCDCKVGTMMESTVGFSTLDRCELLVGQNCGPDYDDGTYYYDPMENFYSWTKSKSPVCFASASCRHEQFFYGYKCWCDRGQLCLNNSMGLSSKEVGMILERNAIIADNFILNIDNSCNADFQKMLVDPSAAVRRRTLDRIQQLHTLSDYNVEFCNLKLYLNCSGRSSRCDCWDPLAFEKGHCRIKNKLPCGKSFGMETKLYEQSISNVHELGQMLEFNLQPECIQGASCQKVSGGGGGGGGDSYRCMCLDITQAGAYCNDSKSIIVTNLFEKQNGWPFPQDDSHYRLYHEFNHNFHIIESRMSLEYDDTCYTKNHQYFLLLMSFFFNNFANAGELLYDQGRTIQTFERVLTWTKTLQESNIPFCVGFRGLHCFPFERRCRCMKGFHWEPAVKECLIDAGKPCGLKRLSTTMWDFKCSPRAVCNVSKKACDCKPGFEGERCDELISSLKPRKSPTVKHKSSLTTKRPFSFVKTLEEQGLAPSEERSSKRKSEAFHSGNFELIPMGELWESILREEDDGASSPNPRNYRGNVRTVLNFREDEADSPDPGSRAIQGSEEHSAEASSSHASGRLLGVPFDDLPQDILDRMTLPLNAPCDPAIDPRNYSPRSGKDKAQDSEDPSSGDDPKRRAPRQNPAAPLCNGTNYLNCHPIRKVCACDVVYDLQPGKDGICYIRPTSLCGTNDMIGVRLDMKRQPSCFPGYICDRSNYNLFKCRPTFPDERISLSKAVFSLKLLFSPSTLVCLTIFWA